MTREATCPCGIARVDCDYHKPPAEAPNAMLCPSCKRPWFEHLYRTAEPDISFCFMRDGSWVESPTPEGTFPLIVVAP